MTLADDKPTSWLRQKWFKGLAVFAVGSIVGWSFHVIVGKRQNAVSATFGIFSTCLNAHKLYATEAAVHVEYPPDATDEFNARARKKTGLALRERQLQKMGSAYLGGHIVPTPDSPATVLIFKDRTQIVSLCGFKDNSELAEILSQKPKVDLTLSIFPRDNYSMVLIGDVPRQIREVLSTLIDIAVPQ